MSRQPRHTTRRGFIAALLGGGTATAALTPVETILERTAPLSGSTWRTERTRPTNLENPYGDATITYDEYHVPHVESESESAASFALGVAQAADRLFEMDVMRRTGRGSLSAVMGERTVDQDVLYTKLDVEGAAAASARAIEGTPAAEAYAAFAAGVSAYIEASDPGVPFGILDYEPEPWTVTDSLIVGRVLGWLISGGFDGLRADVKRAALDEETYRELYPRQFDHDVPILRDSATGASDPERPTDAVTRVADPEFLDWLSTVESDRPAGSNAWLIDGEHTESGRPLVAGDPHLMLQVPPVWYEQEWTVDGLTTRGITIPGIPEIVAGENDHGSWTMTAAMVSQTDVYTYETVENGERYRYRGEWRAFETDTRTIDVLDGENREIAVTKTVHGPCLDREVNGETHHVGVSWVGLAGTREAQAFYRMARATDREAFEDALDLLDLPTLNYLYADTDGDSLSRTVGQIPIREVDGERVAGDRVFDGSAGEGEWAGFEPYDDTDWEGFVPPGDMPAARNPEYVASANQRITDDPASPLGHGFASGYRAERLYERLDATIGAGDTVDAAFCESLQLDTLNPLARELVPPLLDVRDRVDDEVAAWLDELDGWDYRMDRDSTAALVFFHCHRAFREETWSSFLADTDLGTGDWPAERVLFELPPDSHVFGGDRSAVLARAARAAGDTLAESDHEVYGDLNTTDFDHFIGSVVSGLNYPEYPTDGDWLTVRAFAPEGDFGASYRFVSSVGGETRTVLPGGNDGSPLSDHYDDQLRMWADGEYRLASTTPTGPPDITIEEADR